MMILRFGIDEGELVMTRRFWDCACQVYVRTQRRYGSRGALVRTTSRSTVCRGG
jgi:hypothetical protein